MVETIATRYYCIVKRNISWMFRLWVPIGITCNIPIEPLRYKTDETIDEKAMLSVPGWQIEPIFQQKKPTWIQACNGKSTTEPVFAQEILHEYRETNSSTWKSISAEGTWAHNNGEAYERNESHAMKRIKIVQGIKCIQGRQTLVMIREWNTWVYFDVKLGLRHSGISIQPLIFIFIIIV